MSSATDCIFCKIAQGVIPAPRIYEDETVFAIRDIQPQAKHHFLVISKEHVSSLEAAFPTDGPGRAELLGKMMEAGTRIAREQGLLPAGFRAVINTNLQGGQTVFHLHLHILGGQQLRGGFA